MKKFKEMIDDRFGVNVQDCPTITSLAFKIFKANYYDEDKNPIPLLNREIFTDLKEWYFGGHVDAYKPFGPVSNGSLAQIKAKLDYLEDKSLENIRKVFDTLKHYDVNSLYPDQMKHNKYPTEVICKFIGDIKSEPEFNKLYQENLVYIKLKYKLLI